MTTQTANNEDAGGTPPAEGVIPPAAEGGAAWYGGFDDDTKAFVETKGWKEPANVVAAYREAEKLIGLEKVPLPKDENDKAGWDRLYKAVGRPDAPEGYEIPVPEGDSGEFANVFKQKAHEFGLGKKAASGMAEWYNSEVDAAKVAAETAFKQQVEEGRDKLKTEWGSAHDERMAVAKQAALRFIPGADAAEKEGFLDKIEGVLGTEKTFKFMAELGAAIREDKMIGMGEMKPMTSTPEQAKQEIAALQKDKEFGAKYLAGDVGAVKKMQDLQKAVLSMPV